MAAFVLFLFGAAVGSFLNVISFRYDPARFLLAGRVVGGRSRCPHCRHGLEWFELVPLLSFAFLRGRCRRCRAVLSPQYPLVEALCGALFALVPARLAALFPGLPLGTFAAFSAAWIFALTSLLLLAAIDIRLGIIPDELNVFLAVLGAFFALVPLGQSSLLGVPAISFGAWQGRFAAAISVGAFFWLLVLITRGRGMGLGDVKLAGALGFLYGFPDAVGVIAAAFFLGALWGIGAVTLGTKTMKSAIPFGPFLALGAALVFFGGAELVRILFSL